MCGLRFPMAAQLLQLVESIIVAVEPVLVHLDDTQQSRSAFRNFSDQLCSPVKLAIMFFASQRQQL